MAPVVEDANEVEEVSPHEEGIFGGSWWSPYCEVGRVVLCHLVDFGGNAKGIRIHLLSELGILRTIVRVLWFSKLQFNCVLPTRQSSSHVRC